MEVTDFLSRLEGVKGRNGSWIARCPSHQDRTPSLTVKELGDGRILIHCFGGCGTDSVLGVLGLAMTDLFPEPLATHLAPVRSFSAADALRALARDSATVTIALEDLARGKTLSPDDIDDLAKAAGRIAAATEFTCGS